jgi:hypothetical protein
VPAGIVGGAGKTQARLAGAILAAAIRGARLGAERGIALALVVGAVTLEDAVFTAVAVLAACPNARSVLAFKVLVATAGTACAARGFVAVALVGAAIAIGIRAAIRTTRGVANWLPSALAVLVAGLAVLALAADTGVATPIRTTFAVVTIGGTAQAGIVALIGRRPTTPVLRATASGAIRAIHPAALIGGVCA